MLPSVGPRAGSGLDVATVEPAAPVPPPPRPQTQAQAQARRVHSDSVKEAVAPRHGGGMRRKGHDPDSRQLGWGRLLCCWGVAINHR